MLINTTRRLRSLVGSACVAAVVGSAGLAAAQDRLTHGIDAVHSGWTVLTPSPDTRFIYVSTSDGDDANDGLTPHTPKRSLDSARRMMRSNHPDWLMLKRGDVFEEGLRIGTRGRSLAEPAVITTYGEHPDRPVIQPPASAEGLFVGSSNWGFFVIRGVEFRAQEAGTGRAGIRVVADTGTGFLIEDVKIDGFKDNLQIQGKPSSGGFGRAVIRRSVIVDAHAPFGGHSQGIYMDAVQEPVLIENVLDHNGWADDGTADATIFNHNVYIQSNCGPVEVRGNVIARGASHGLQARPGGQVQDNLFLGNALAMFVSRAESEVMWNVVLEGRDIDENNPRGFGIEVKPIEGGLIAHNIIANRAAESEYGYGIQLHKSNNGVSEFRVEVRDNIVYDWPGTLVNVRHGDLDLYTEVTFADNKLMDMDGTSRILWYEPTEFSSDVFNFEDNMYATNRDQSSWFKVFNRAVSVDEWRSLTGENPQPLQRGSFLPDPQRSVGEYVRSVAPELDTTFDSETFLMLAREQSSWAWDADLMAAEVNDWVREGFGIEQP